MAETWLVLMLISLILIDGVLHPDQDLSLRYRMGRIACFIPLPGGEQGVTRNGFN